MSHYMIFRAVTPPNFNFDQYARRSSEPIKFDAVTVVEADNEEAAVDALIGSTGIVVTAFAVVEVYLRAFQAQSKLGKGGILVADPQKELPNGEGK